MYIPAITNFNSSRIASTTTTSVLPRRLGSTIFHPVNRDNQTILRLTQKVQASLEYSIQQGWGTKPSQAKTEKAVQDKLHKRQVRSIDNQCRFGWNTTGDDTFYRVYVCDPPQSTTHNPTTISTNLEASTTTKAPCRQGRFFPSGVTGLAWVPDNKNDDKSLPICNTLF